MKINIKLKNLFIQYADSLDREYFSIFGIPLKDENKLFSFIENNLLDEYFFVYKRGSTKFNDKLEIVQKKDIIKYFNDDYVIYSLDSLDFLSIGTYEASPYNLEGYEITATGNFINILKSIMHTFEFDQKESRLPNL